MMLEFLGEADAAARVRAAVEQSDDVTGTTSEIGARDRREGLSCRSEKTEKIWMDGELVPWDEAQRPRAHAHAALRLGRLRGHPRVRDRRRARRSSASPTTSSGCSTPPS